MDPNADPEAAGAAPPQRKAPPAEAEPGKAQYVAELSAAPEEAALAVPHHEEAPDIKFVRRIMYSPRKYLCGFCSCYCAWVVLLLALLIGGADVIPFSSDVPLYLRDHETYERMDMKIEGEDVADWFIGSDNQLPRQVDKVELELIWVSHDGSSLLNTEQMEYMNRKEIEAISFPRYSRLEDGFCTLANGTQPGEEDQRACLRRDSVLHYTNSSFIDPANVSLSLYNDPLAEVTPNFDQATMDTIFGEWSRFNATEAGIAFAPIWEVVDSSFGTPPGNAAAVACRTVLRFGLPIKGYESSLVDTDDQIDDIGQFLFDTYDSWGDSGSGAGLKLYYYDSEDKMSSLKSAENLATAMGLIVGSVIFVWFYVSVMTGSFFVGSMGIFMLLIVFVPTIIVYRYMFNQQYFGVFNILSLFIVLGIGADDIFVFIDHWNVSKTSEMPPAVRRNQYTRMSWTYQKAGMAMLITSLTTAFAFMANATSTFPAISTFGIFSGVLVVCNYIGVMSFFTSVIAVYYYHFERYPLCFAHRCCAARYEGKIGEDPLPYDEASGGAAASGVKVREVHVQPAPSGTSDDEEARTTDDARQADDESSALRTGSAAALKHEDQGHGGAEDAGAIPRFFGEVWGPKVVSHRLGRPLVLVAFVVILAVFVSFAVQLEPDPNTPQIHPDGTNYAEFTNVKGRYFSARVEDPKEFPVFLIFGAQAIDRTSTNPTRGDDRGTIVWDPDFAINTVESQLFLQELCAAAVDTSNGNPRFVKEGDLRVLYCFMDDFRDWYNSDRDTGKNSTLCPTSTSCVFPVQASHCASGSDTACFDEAIGRWAVDPVAGTVEGSASFKTNFEEWGDYLHAERLEDGSIVLRMIEIEVRTTMRVDVAYEDGIANFKVWERWMDGAMAGENTAVRAAPDNLQSGFQMTEGAWHYFFLQEKLLEEAFAGIFLSLLFAFIVLTLATRNIVVSGLATLTILAIVACVIGFVVMAGWKLGILEAINLILVPGLAVDYVTHMADAYLSAHREDRAGRVNVMLVEVGVSIISGAISTLGASSMMFFAPVSFFFKFACFIFVTIALSCVFSLGFFAALLSAIGPEHGSGSIQPLFDYLWIKGTACIAFFNNLGRTQEKEVEMDENIGAQ